MEKIYEDVLGSWARREHGSHSTHEELAVALVYLALHEGEVFDATAKVTHEYARLTIKRARNHLQTARIEDSKHMSYSLSANSSTDSDGDVGTRGAAPSDS